MRRLDRYVGQSVIGAILLVLVVMLFGKAWCWVCPWDAIEMVATDEWEKQNGVELPDAPDREPSDWGQVPTEYV